MSTPPNASTAAANAPATAASEVTSPLTEMPGIAQLRHRVGGAVAVDVEGDHRGAGGGQRLASPPVRSRRRRR